MDTRGWRAHARAKSVAARVVLACALGGLAIAGSFVAAAATQTATTTAASTTVVFHPVADGRVDESRPTTNFGTDRRLATDGDVGQRLESDLRFDVNGLSEPVTSATLRLFVANNSTQDGPAVYPTTDTWTESGLSWATRPTATGPAVSDFGAMPSSTWAAIDVTQAVTGNGSVNLLLKQPGTDGVVFYAREKTNFQPELVVTTSAPTTTTTTTTPTTTTSTTTTAPPPDTTPPTTPGNFAVTGTSTSSVSVSWTASSDNVGVVGYGLYRNSSQVLTTTGTTYTFTGLACGTSYNLAVDAADAAGNRSSKASLTAPTAACASSGTAPPFRFIYNSDQGNQAAANYGYNLLDVGSAAQADGLPAGTQGLVWVGDYDNTRCSWEVSDSSLASTVKAALGDAKVFGFFFSDEPDPFACPNAYTQHKARSDYIHSLDPLHKTVMVVDSNSGQQTLDQIPHWAGSADYIGLDPYPCYQGQACNYAWIDTVIAAANQGGLNYWGIAQAFQDSTWRWPTTGELSHMLSQWAASRQSGMMTFAWTWDGNWLSDHPDLLSVLQTFNSGGGSAPADTTPPTTPTNFKVTSATGTSVAVSWSASSDNVGVTGYGMYRGGSLVASTNGTSYTFGGLTCGTSYTLAVDATDAAGNRSAKATLTTSTAVCSGDTTPPSTPTGLTQTGATQNSVSLSWNPSADNVGVTGYNVYRGGTLDGTSTTTSYTSSGLACGSSYSFTVQAKDAAGNVSPQSSSLSAGTAACSGSDPVITAAGDICGSSTDCAPTAALIGQINPTRVLTLGDNAYEDGSLSQYMTEYDPNWGAYKAKTSPVPGNHEYHTAGAADYFTYFGSALAPGPYYSYDLGSWHLIALASSEGVDPTAGSAEETWLKQDLAAHANKCVLAYWHEPRFSSGTTHGSNTAWSAVWNDLYAAHADVVLNGHEHNYERFAKQNPSGVADANGIREIISGTGGVSHGYPFGTPLPTSEVRNDSTWGVLKLTLHSGSYDWQFVPIAGSTFTDAGSSTCT